MRKGENIYLRKDGRWEGRYSKGRKINGKIKYGYVYGKTYTEVRQKMFPLRIHYMTIQQTHGVSSETFEEWASYWLSHVQHEVKPATFSSYYYKIYKYVLPILKDIPLNEMSAEQGRDLLKELRTKLARSTVHVIFRVLNKCLNHAKKCGKILSNPLASLQLPRVKKKRLRHFLVRSKKR